MSAQNGEQIVELVGEVRGVALNNDAAGGGVFQLRLPDGVKVEVAFSEEHKDRVTVALWQHKVLRLQITGRGDFGPDGRLRRISRLDTQIPGLVRAYPTKPADPEKRIASGSSIPDEDWVISPQDFAANRKPFPFAAFHQGAATIE